MKIAIVGYARDGKAAFRYWNHDGNDITICDQNSDLEVPEGVAAKLGPDYLQDLDSYDLIVRTAGLAPRLIAEANPSSPKILDKVTGIVDEFLRVCPTKNIIGVTGTKGKGTTSTLIAKMLEADGKRVHLGGNIGIPALELLNNGILQDDWVVLEQSSFQLINQKQSPHIAVCLMVVPEHLDWHKDLEEYLAAKQQLFANQTSSDIAIYNGENENSTKIASVSPAKKIPYLKEPGAYVLNDDIVIDQTVIIPTKDLKLLGKHNWQNVCAAVTAVWQITQDLTAMKSVLTTFSGLEHRLEFVAEKDGVKYYDDSFGTTPETAIVAIEAFAEPKVVILGGSDKGSTYDKLAETVRDNNVKSVVTIGTMGPVIAEQLRSVGYTNIVDGGQTMASIVDAAREAAAPGDVVLLSPGCASFGLFKDYKDRGEQFTQAVQSLA